MSTSRDPIDIRWFSAGQELIQQKVGTRQHAHHMAEHGIFSEYIPKHQQYWLANQPVVYASVRDPITQQVWVTPLYAHLNMNSSSDALFHPILSFLPSKHDTERGSLVRISAQSRAAHDLFDSYIQPHAHLALVFVDAPTRDRFRMNGLIERVDKQGNIFLRVKHSFAFCPKYVKRRVVDVEHMMGNMPHTKHSATLTTTTSTSPDDIASLLDTQSFPFQPHLFPVDVGESSFSLSHLSRAAASHDCVLPPPLVTWILSSHDMYVGSGDPHHNNEVGYKGGTPGFVRVLDNRVIIYPDYFGNPFFTVLGNSITYPQMALCFIDHNTGNTLQISGIVSLQYSQASMDLDTADRHVVFRVTEWRVQPGNRPGFYPILWRDLDSSSHNYVLRDVPVVPLLHQHIMSEFISRGMNEEKMEMRFETRLKREAEKMITTPSTTTTTTITINPTSTIYHGTSHEIPCIMRVTAIISEDHPMISDTDASTPIRPSILTYELEISATDNVYTHLKYIPGQYATFDIILPNTVIRRSWTISKPLKRLNLIQQHDDRTRLQHHMTYTRTRFCISVKRIEGGRVTPWMHDTVGVGTKLKLIGIEGNFVLPMEKFITSTTTSTSTSTSSDSSHTLPTSITPPCDIIPTPSTPSKTSLLFFTAGVGITPVIAFLTAIHDLRCRVSSSSFPSPFHTCPITLFHSERYLYNIPFTSTLHHFMTHGNVPVLSHVNLAITAGTETRTGAETATSDTSHLDDAFMDDMKTSLISTCYSRLTLDTITSHLSQHDIKHSHVYICGPPSFQQHVITLLEHADISSQHIHMEQFDY